MKRWLPVLLLPGMAVSAAHSLAANQAASGPLAAPTTTSTANTQPQPRKDQKPAKVSRHNRHEAEKMFREGADAIAHNDPKTAQKDFLRAHDLDPNNVRYPLSAEIARQFVITQMVRQAEKAKMLGHVDESRATLAEALKLDPANMVVAQHIGELADEAVVSSPQIQSKPDDPAPPVVLAARDTRGSFHLRTDEQSLIRQVLNAYGIQATLDTSVKSQQVRFDVDNVDFVQATNMLKLATNTFFVPLDPIHVVVAADTKDNRSRYERQVMETIYFPGLSATELTDMGNLARNVFGAEHGLVQASHNTMVIRATGPTLAALNQTYTDLLAGRSELMLEVHMYEIDRSHTKDVGIILPNSTTVFNVPSELNSIIASNSSLVQQIISSGLASAGDYSAIAAILIASGAITGTIFNNPFATFGGGITLTGVQVNSASANLLLNSSEVRSVDDLQLRILDQEEATVRSGERYPIITSSYSNLATSSALSGVSSSLLASLGLSSSALSSSSSEVIPQVQYEDLGLTLKVKPRINGSQDVSMNIDLKLDSLQGTTLNDIPVLDNRQYTGTVSLRPGDSALVVSAISRQESAEITGIPGLSDIPGLGQTTNRNATMDTTELAIVITPKIIRLTHRDNAGQMRLLPQHP